MTLTENQNRAISFLDGNALINAGAGSGKSTVLVARILKLISEHNVPTKKILGMTFTKEAADNMRNRLAKFIGKKRAGEVSLTTFHSFAYRFLKSKFPYEYNGKNIMQSWWKLKTMYEIVENNDLNINGGELASFISYQKANMIIPGMDVLIDGNVSYVSGDKRESLQSAFDQYCRMVKNARVLDFDDMLVDFYYKLLNDEELQIEIKSQYSYILVDEFQDTNSVSLAIIKLISKDNIFAVGDFRQGIYGFINATINNILDFKYSFKNVEVIELLDNFRSTKDIVKISNDIISVSPIESYKDFSDQVASKDIENQPVQINIVSDEYVESESIIHQISEEMENNPDLTYKDFCLLSRTNAQLGMFESIFAEHEIPVNVSSNKSFFDRKEISDMIAYLTHIHDKTDDMSIRKIMNSPTRFLPKTILTSLDEYSYSNEITTEQAMISMDSGKHVNTLSKLVSKFEKWRNLEEDMSAYSMLKKVYEDLNYEDFMMKNAASHSDKVNKLDSIDRLFDLSKKFTNIKSFLGHISLVKNNNKKNKDAVNLMTVHASKGLEFNTVFVTGANEKSFPHEMNPDYEEERRLFYVATSRAIQSLYIYCPMIEMGKQEKQLPSPFLSDICGEKLIDAFNSIEAGKTEFSFTY